MKRCANPAFFSFTLSVQLPCIEIIIALDINRLLWNRIFGGLRFYLHIIQKCFGNVVPGMGESLYC